jgi:peptidoglycan-associated lipoprotein
MKVQIHGFIVALLLALVAGCSSTGDTKSEGAAVEDRGMGTEGGAVTTGADATGTFGGYSLDDPNSPLARRVIYFEYDSSEILPEDQQLISDHAAYLAANNGQRVTLEGHSDERGSPEYNIALGDRRAQSVRRAFELQGVMPEQITIVSYGEEKPAAEGHSEAAWRLNRRVEIIYQSY